MPAVRIYGLDFTSAPRTRKPITCAACMLDSGTLHVEALEHFTTWDQFEQFLARPGPWIAGFDFPFGLPEAFVRAQWPGCASWAAYVEAISRLSKADYLALIKRFRDARPRGDKHPLRHTDSLAGAVSPLMVYGVPVGRMLFQGAPRLLAAGVSVIPCHPNGDSRIALETYPALVARRWLGTTAYKNDTRRKQTPQQAAARAALLRALTGEDVRSGYGVSLAVPGSMVALLVDEPGGDNLDALACALQAAWAAAQPSYGMPADHPTAAIEGWIAAPGLSG